MHAGEVLATLDTLLRSESPKLRGPAHDGRLSTNARQWGQGMKACVLQACPLPASAIDGVCRLALKEVGLCQTSLAAIDHFV